MKLVTKAKDIKRALKDISPNKIAVAYLGADWKKYVKINQDTEIILSPTLGSNPSAIEKIIDELGYENVFFLDSLHSKFYLGLDSVLLGSCNLSYNGLDGGLHEAALVVSDIELIKKLNAEFEEYKKLAQVKYPDKKSKDVQIKKLSKLWEFANREGILKDEQLTVEIESYKYSENRKFHLSGCVYGNIEIKEDEEYTKASFKDYVNLLEKDIRVVKKNEWILLCYVNKNSKVTKVDWLYVDVLLPNRVIGEGIGSLLAATLKGKKKRMPPFSLKEKSKVIKQILNTSDYLGLLKGDIWSIPRSTETRLFVEKLKSELKTTKL